MRSTRAAQVGFCNSKHLSYVSILGKAHSQKGALKVQKGLLVAAAAEAAAETAVDTAADDIDVEVEDDIDDLEDGELADEEEEAPGTAPQVTKSGWHWIALL